MSRQLKFRAWDQFNGVYYYSDKYKNLAKFFVDVQKYIDGGNHIVIEEFIGLKGKNDVEIYESDIVSCGIDAGDKEIYIVAWSEFDSYPAFDLQGFDGESNGIYEYDTSGWIEVIGSIHQNPELLK